MTVVMMDLICADAAVKYSMCKAFLQSQYEAAFETHFIYVTRDAELLSNSFLFSIQLKKNSIPNKVILDLIHSREILTLQTNDL